MADPMVGQIALFPYTFAPAGWLYCAGYVLEIAMYKSLFTLLGTKFGGDGVTTFTLPNLNAAAPPNLSYCISCFGSFQPASYEAVIGETMLSGVPLSPTNLMECTGQLLVKLQYPLLNTYMGTRFGGNAQNFALPDLQNLAPDGCQYQIAVQGVPPTNIDRRTPFVGEIFLLPYQEPTQQLLLCNGAELPIAQNTALATLLGTRFGGSGQDFALPNLTSAAPTGYSYYIAAQGNYPNSG